MKNWDMPRRRPEFESGIAVVEAAKLKKFSDADGSQSLWLTDAGRTDFSVASGITNLFLRGCQGFDLGTKHWWHVEDNRWPLKISD